ncbi:MAG: type II toxin-antitoxin system Phd/YefM family antitoxin [Nitrospirae bacterium]|nr:type II toxin-antitoxin system Phd/YefM family antitoxin [Nitrospirota bacterium]
MLVQTENMIPVTKLQKELTRKLKEVSDTDEPLYVLRNNEMAAVIVSAKEFEVMKQAEEAIEFLEIAEAVKQRLKSHTRSRNIPWEKIKKKHGL